jgi:DNA primase
VGIVEEDVARVRSEVDFVSVVTEHLALRRSGTRWVGLCPFHSENSGSFSVNGELGLYYCFGCGAKGDAITFVRELEHLDFVEAVERLAAKAGISLRYDESENGGRDRQRRKRIHETLEKAVEWYHQRLLTSSEPGARAARAYLRRERGYDGDVVREYRIGWAPDAWDQLVRSLGVPAPLLVDAGLATLNERGGYTDFFRARIMFPIFEPGGQPVGAGGRQLPGGRPPKYKNTSNTTVYDKSRVLYGLNWAKRPAVAKDRIVVCEGYTDVIGLHQAGVGEAVATCGTSLTEGHVKALRGFARRVVLAYDGDSAGQSAAEKFYEWEKRYDVEIRVLALPGGADPADLARSDPGALAAAVENARPYLGFRLERHWSRSDLTSPESRSRAAGQALAMVAEHPDPLVRDQYLMEIADRCRVDAERLRTMAAAPIPATASGLPRRSRRNDADSSAAPVSGPEMEALRLCIQRGDEIVSRLDDPLFAHVVARNAFGVVRRSADVHEAIEVADPQVADLLQRLAVETTDAEPDDVMIRLVERAVQRELAELQAEMRQQQTSEQPAYAPTIAWLKLGLERMKVDDVDYRQGALEAERLLVAWLAERHALLSDRGLVEPVPGVAG